MCYQDGQVKDVLNPILEKKYKKQQTEKRLHTIEWLLNK